MYGLKKFEGRNMKTKFLLLLLLPLYSTAPREIAGEDEKVDTKADHVGTHSHEDQRGAKMFSNNQVDLGNIIVSGSATGDDVLIGHQLEIDVLGYARGHDGHAHEQDGHAHEQDGHAHEQDGHAHGQDGHAHEQDGHAHEQDGHAHEQDGHAHEQDDHTHEQDGHTHRYVGHTQDHHEQGIYNAITKEDMKAIRELKETIETIEDALKKIANGRHRRDVAGGLDGDELLLHHWIHLALAVMKNCAWYCNAIQINLVSEDIKSTFARIKQTGTVSLLLLEHFARLRGLTFDAIEIVEEALKDELDALLRAMELQCPHIKFCTCNNGETCDKEGCCEQGNYPMNCTCQNGSIFTTFTPYCGGERPINVTCEDGTKCHWMNCCGKTMPAEITCRNGTTIPLIKRSVYWSIWKEITPCSATCGPATKAIMRTCKNQRQGYECSGSPLEFLSCGLPDCPIDGGWSDWLEYSQCSATCGPAIKIIVRTCTNPAPANGGAGCSGLNYGHLDCDHDDCDVKDGYDGPTGAAFPAGYYDGPTVAPSAADGPPPTTDGPPPYMG